MNIDRIMQILGEDQRALKRQSYNPETWTMEEMMEAVRRIGCSLNPRFVIDNSNRFVYENLIYWLMNDSRMQAHGFNGGTIEGDLRKGIYLGGPVGSGKTMATEIMGKLSYVLGIKIQIGDSTPVPLRWKNVRTDYVVSQFVRQGESDEYKKENVVCFQDLGTEPLEAIYMGNRTNVMKQIIEYRGDYRDRLTLFTSNLMLNSPELSKMYGERAVSRLCNMCNLLVLGGKDRRR